jgi:hypothetical protein
MEQQSLIPEIEHEREERQAPNGGNGRPRGATNIRRRMLEKMLLIEAPAILRKLIELAKEGDILAAKLILERAYPKPKGPPLEIAAQQTSTSEDIRAAMHEVLRQITTGEIPPDDGNQLMAAMRHVLEAHRIPTYDAAITVTDAPASSARDQLAQRLARLIEARQVQQSAVSDQQSAPNAAES